MKMTHRKAIIGLYVLTLLSALASTYLYGIKGFTGIILGLSAVKFWLVSFQFMEMKLAHPFWKVIIGVYLIAFVGAVWLILS